VERPRVAIRLQFDRIPPGTEIGPHRHGVETLVYVAAGEIVFEHGPDLERRTVVRSGDVLYEAPGEYHLVRNDSSIDALALLAAVDAPEDHPEEDLPAGQAEGEPVRRREGARVVEGPGTRMRVLVEPGDFGTETFSLGEMEIEPGGGTGWHRHQRFEHVIVVFEGRGTVRIGSLEETLEPLKGVRVEMGLPHAITNTGRTTLRYYVCSTPATDPLSDREDVDPPS
jgi:quercetin dioxygenase-like cupin family protein